MEKFDHSLVASTMRGYDQNNLFNFISTVIGKDEAFRLMEMYRVGTSKHWNGATVFWQISGDGDVRGGKIMHYDRLTGHRVQEPYPHITWVHTALHITDFKLKQCFFGEHLLPHIRDKPVALVESEKTAILATHYLPQYLWLATGGKCSCMNRETIKSLQGREVMLVPDLNATDEWRRRMTFFDELGIKVTLFEKLEQMATDEERAQGLDIADYLIAEQTPHGILEQMMQRNPELRQLVESLKLEIVSIEDYQSDESPQQIE